MTHVRRTLYQSRAYLLIIIAVLTWPAISEAGRRIAESRAWRDLTGQTPFYSVTVTRAGLIDRGAELSGEMVKRRCEYAGLSAYVRIGPAWVRARIDTRPEDAVRPPGDRPSLPDAQLWGPWVIEWRGPPNPFGWAIYAHHRCPDGPQVNLFAAGVWPTIRHAPQDHEIHQQ